MEPNPSKQLNLKVRLVRDPQFPDRPSAWHQVEVWDQNTGAILPIADLQIDLTPQIGLPHVHITCLPEIEIHTTGIASLGSQPTSALQPSVTPKSDTGPTTLQRFFNHFRETEQIEAKLTSLKPESVIEKEKSDSPPTESKKKDPYDIFND